MTPVVDVVVAVHDLRREIGRAAASVLAARVPVRLTIVAHHLRADEVLGALGAVAEDDRLRVVELHDRQRAPAGPFHHRLARADAR
ncbi:MAG: glycosyltransferase family 2 protein, partial [Cellulosimicrobium funkei]